MNKKIAIVTNGGGMNCSYSAGVLNALATEYNFTDPDILVGSSGSSGSLAYYISRQYSSMRTIWTNLLTSKKFISLGRLTSILNVDYLIDEVFKKQEPLAVDEINNSKTKLFIATTAYLSGETIFFSNDSTADVFEYLRASKAIPMAYNKKVNINGVDYVDGSLSALMSTGVEKAISEGATDIIVIKDGIGISLVTKLCWKVYSIFVNKNLSASIKKYLTQKDVSLIKYAGINIITISPSKK